MTFWQQLTHGGPSCNPNEMARLNITRPLWIVWFSSACSSADTVDDNWQDVLHIDLVNMWEYGQVHYVSFISTDLLFVFSKVKATRASVCWFYILLTFSSYIPQSMFQPSPHGEQQFAHFVSHQPGILIPSRGKAQSACSESADEM